ncbi:hypothetical protein [Taibaiella koreensis]|uniref:hypothetical protein n=1 Tax=Taibaiella koreensis TaxID=1268548 RepID=UPI0013C3478D|nr:hypothetical protein [Taibaiella koreensis]
MRTTTTAGADLSSAFEQLAPATFISIMISSRTRRPLLLCQVFNAIFSFHYQPALT